MRPLTTKVLPALRREPRKEANCSRCSSEAGTATIGIPQQGHIWVEAFDISKQRREHVSSPMVIARHKRNIRLRAVEAVLALLLGSLAPVLSLASSEPDVCSMSCCVAARHCCCTPRHVRVAGQVADDRGEVGSPDISSPCPQGCPATSAISQIFPREAEHTPAHDFGPPDPSITSFELLVRSHQSPHLQRSSPRGPPVRLSYLSA